MTKTARFRQLVESPQILILPGAHDALTARVIEQAGFDAFTCGGFAISATLLGQPDTGQLTMTEMADYYARLADATTIPFIADGDTGYGNTTNVARMVRAYERAGVGALFIEDQVWPKRCGHMEGKRVVDRDEMVAKLKAALDARRDDDMMLMARTDAIATHGFDEALERANLYREAGADIIFVESPVDMEQIRRIPREVDAPVMLNQVDGGKTPTVTPGEAQAMGYAMIVYPTAMSFTVAAAAARLVEALKRDGHTDGMGDDMLRFDDFTSLLGLPELRAREAAYASGAGEADE